MAYTAPTVINPVQNIGHDQVNCVDSAPTLIRPENKSGRGATIQNCSHLGLAGMVPYNVYVGGSGVTAANGFPLAPGGIYTTRSGAPVYGICATGETCKTAYMEDK